MTKNKIDEEIKTLTGQPVMLDADTPLTYKAALLLSCETYRPISAKPGSMLMAYKIGIKLTEVNDNLRLDEDEISKLKEIVDTSPNFPAVVIGRLHDFINNLKQDA